MTQTHRIEVLDFARGLALVAMTVFHFGFDLELFGLKEPGYIAQPHWKYFARSIASSFLFLAGFGLYLAHVNGIRWMPWRRRMIKIISAAMLITAVTYVATRGQYIFFGILHAIALASLVCLAFLSFPAWIIAIVAAAVFAVGQSFETTLLNHWAWWWTGLSQAPISSSDYVPVFPWFSAPLFGVAAAKIVVQNNWIELLSKPKFDTFWGRATKFIGRHSLVYYLLHQPVMIALLLGFLYLAGYISF